MATYKTKRRQKVRYRIRKKIAGTNERPRLSVFRSNSGIYAQLIDDLTGNTVASSSTKELKLNNLSVDNSTKVGEDIAKKAIANGYSNCVFDRGGYLFHGNVKALAEGARKGGLNF